MGSTKVIGFRTTFLVVRSKRQHLLLIIVHRPADFLSEINLELATFLGGGYLRHWLSFHDAPSDG
jgi:hypothetical protein